VLGNEVVIEAGLSVGEQVAATGAFKLQDSALVSIAVPQVAQAGSANNSRSN